MKYGASNQSAFTHIVLSFEQAFQSIRPWDPQVELNSLERSPAGELGVIVDVLLCLSFTINENLSEGERGC